MLEWEEWLKSRYGKETCVSSQAKAPIYHVFDQKGRQSYQRYGAEADEISWNNPHVHGYTALWGSK
jgi:hypothetical protein